jgi:4-diphosphocytidyl-2-C-methyl-D-erythritol kinase
MLAPIVEASPAKLNLTLHITGKRGDGYHLLESVVAFTEFGDRLEFYPDDIVSLDIQGEFSRLIAPDHNNSILKATRMLQEITGCRQGARITLHKNIPVGAGLGGGSGNAAATIRGLLALWKVTMPKDLQAHAALLGSDISVCLRSQPAIVRGVGEQVMPLAMPGKMGVVLLNPRIPLATPEVYRAFSGAFTTPEHVHPMQSYAELIRVLVRGHNALEAPAVALCPAIVKGLAALRTLPGCDIARMSGSGATCFGLFQKISQAQQAAHTLNQKLPEWWVKATVLQ